MTDIQGIPNPYKKVPRVSFQLLTITDNVLHVQIAHFLLKDRTRKPRRTPLNDNLT